MSINQFERMKENNCVYWQSQNEYCIYDIEIPDCTDSGKFILDIYDRIDSNRNRIDIECESFSDAVKKAKRHYKKLISYLKKRKII